MTGNTCPAYSVNLDRLDATTLPIKSVITPIKDKLLDTELTPLESINCNSAKLSRRIIRFSIRSPYD